MPASLPAEVLDVCERFLSVADDVVPGVVVGLYVEGSTVLGDLRPASDLDVIVVAEPLPDVDALTALHHRMRSAAEPTRLFEATYVEPGDLTTPATDIGPRPSHHENQVVVGDFQPNPVTWRTLARHGVAVRGETPASIAIPHDDREVRSWCARNVEDYWVPWLDLLAARDAEATSDAVLDWIVLWCVSGVLRIHRTVTSGDIVSKRAACDWGLDVLPEDLHAVCRHAAAVRSGADGDRLAAAAALPHTAAVIRFVVDAVT